MRLASLLVAITALVCLPAHAAAPGSVVSPGDLQSTKISYRLGSVTKNKKIYCLAKTAGDAKTVTGGLLFTPFATTLAQLKAKKAPSVKIDTYVALSSAGKKGCAKLLRNGPAPTPTPGPGTTNFDSAGNVTEVGKVAFGIPANLTGKISTGKIIVQSYCTCHVERLGWAFPALRAATKQEPMFFDESQLPDQSLADITAYLNRFRP